MLYTIHIFFFQILLGYIIFQLELIFSIFNSALILIQNHYTYLFLKIMGTFFFFAASFIFSLKKIVSSLVIPFAHRTIKVWTLSKVCSFHSAVFPDLFSLWYIQASVFPRDSSFCITSVLFSAQIQLKVPNKSGGTLRQKGPDKQPHWAKQRMVNVISRNRKVNRIKLYSAQPLKPAIYGGCEGTKQLQPHSWSWSLCLSSTTAHLSRRTEEGCHK